MRRLWYVMWKELLELRQDPRLFGVIFIAPVVQLTMLGYAATTDVRDVPLVIVDQDRSARSRELIARFDASPYFTVVGTANNLNDIDPWLERGRAWMALAIPGDYRESLGNGRPATVQVVADGTDSNSAGVALGYAANLVASYNLELAERQATAMGRTLPPRPIEARIRVWFNPQLESRDFMIPGILALLLLVVTMNLSSMAIVREREIGTLEQLNVTPLGRLELILGKLLPYGLIGLIDVVVVSLAAVLWFEIPLLGSKWLLFGTSAIYLLTTLGLGLFISTISNTQQQAMMTATFFFLTPMLYLSGFIFPIENMPAVIQPITYLIPLRYFIVIVRGIFLKGVGVAVLWPQIVALLTWGVVIVCLAVARSRKTLT
jgi:ABC-2 type transport system permease protein